MQYKNVGEILDRFKEIIDTSKLEAPVQAFLEEHPFLISGSSHYIRSPVISQFPLGADFKVDFAFITGSFTNGPRLNLFEIERPNMKIFARNDDFSQAYNHAFQQLQDWASWCEDNRDTIVKMLRPLYPPIGPLFRTRCKLIAGRRANVNTPKRRRRLTAKAMQLPQLFGITTWDGFIEIIERELTHSVENLHRIRCVRYRNEDFHGIPPFV